MPVEYEGAGRPRGKRELPKNRTKDDTDENSKVDGKRKNRKK
jgi:hypothetical protein